MSDEFLDLENMNTEEILKLYKSESSVLLEPEVDLDFQGHPNMVASVEIPEMDSSPSKHKWWVKKL